MKFKTFEKLINTAKSIYEELDKKDKNLEEVFGEDSCIMSRETDVFISNILNSIELEYGIVEDDNIIDWLFWENIMSNDSLDLVIDGITYDGSIKNVWLSLEGALDEKPIKSDIKKSKEEDLDFPEDLGELNSQKLFYLKTKQEELLKLTKSEVLSKVLFDRMKPFVYDDSSYDVFKIKLNEHMEEISNKEKRILEKLKRHLNTALLRFADEEDINPEEVFFEVVNVFNRLKENKELIDFSIQQYNDSISVDFLVNQDSVTSKNCYIRTKPIIDIEISNMDI